MNVRRPSFAVLPTLSLLLGTVVTVTFVGCSAAAGNSALSGLNPISAAKTSVPVLVTDAPSDQLLTFTLTLDSIVLTDTAGKTASILPTPTTIEACHLNGIEEALVMAAIPQDTYASATITYSNAQISYADFTGKVVQVTPTLSTTSYSTTFTTPITVGTTSTSLLVDLLVGQSVTISGTAVTVAPVFNISNVVPPAAGSSGHNQNGGNTHQLGAIVSTTATGITVQPASGAAVTFVTNGSTVYQGGISLASLTAGNLVEIDFTVQDDGSLLATRVELDGAPSRTQHADRLAGPVTLINSATSFQITLGEALG